MTQTPWGDPYVLYESARSKKGDSTNFPPQAAQLVETAIGFQERLIDQFVATDPAKLADLPLDPTGKLLARTLPTSVLDAAFIVGVWQPRAWLHFEDDPIGATAWYATAGVKMVAKGLTTVYQTDNAGGAVRMTEELTKHPGVWSRAISGVPGLPAAKCAARQAISPGFTVHEIAAHFRCIAYTDNYAFIAYSDTQQDVKQQIAAQYRILAGK